MLADLRTLFSTETFMARGHSFLWTPKLVVLELVTNALIALAAVAIAAVLARAERVNPRVNAVVATLYDQARREAAALPASDGAFRGVPLLLKDLDAALAGVPLTAGSRFLAEFRPVRDGTIVERFRRAG